MSLKPINIVQAAEADLNRRHRNRMQYERGLDERIEQYAFYAPQLYIETW